MIATAAPMANDGAVAAALEEAVVEYGGRRALGPLSLTLAAGTSTALLGASGSGKSTALRLLAGLEAPASGRARAAGAPGETAVVFQAPTLMPWADALSNASLPLELSGVSRAEARRRALEALHQVGLAAVGALKPRQLSGGMAMRVSLARAMVTRPRALLLDEPFAALDEVARRRLADDVHAAWRATGAALLFVTHSVEEAVYMADRVLILTRGPGRLAAEIATPGPSPRPDGYRADPIFRSRVEEVSRALQRAAGEGGEDGEIPS